MKYIFSYLILFWGLTANAYLTPTGTPGSGTVTSVDMTVPSFLSVSGNPITSTGTLALSLSGVALPVANGGTGLTSGTSGGLLAFTASGVIASTGVLSANQLIIGKGAGVVPASLAAGSQYQSLVMGASNPGYGAVNLSQAAAITGTLPVGNGGTGQTTASGAINALVPTQSGHTDECLSTNGSVVSWATCGGGGSGANTTLSNLTTTAINQDLTFDTGSAAYLTTVAGAPSLSLNISSGTSSADSSGGVYIRTGVSSSASSGEYVVSTGTAGGSQQSGVGLVTTGNAENGASGYLTVATGNSTNAGSGILTVGTGTGDSTGAVTIGSGAGVSSSGDTVITTGATAGTRGFIKLVDGSEGNVGDVWTQTNADGSGAWQTPSGGGFPGTDWVAYTPTYTTGDGGGANMVLAGQYRRVGDSIDIRVLVSFTGTPSFTRLQVSIPSGLTVDTSKIVDTVSMTLGQVTILNLFVADYSGQARYNSTTDFVVSVDNTSGSYAHQVDVNFLTPFTFGAGDTVDVLITSLPITQYAF